LRWDEYVVSRHSCGEYLLVYPLNKCSTKKKQWQVAVFQYKRGSKTPKKNPNVLNLLTILLYLLLVDMTCVVLGSTGYIRYSEYVKVILVTISIWLHVSLHNWLKNIYILAFSSRFKPLY